MTGGTELAGTINRNLAKACATYGMGMGLGSCRIILDDDTYLQDFQMRPYIGDDQAFYANLGIAQVETLLAENQLNKIQELVKKLDADGLIVHVNPFQEWLQPEGDRFERAPLDTLDELLDAFEGRIIVKEVGQGMGPRSLEALMSRPFQAIEFAANGGTNFAKLEILRSDPKKAEAYHGLPQIGAAAVDMVNHVNEIDARIKSQCTEFIISGGVQDFLDGYYLTEKIGRPAVYGQASALLKRAQVSYEAVAEYLEQQIRGLELAHAYLHLKEA